MHTILVMFRNKCKSTVAVLIPLKVLIEDIQVRLASSRIPLKVLMFRPGQPVAGYP